MTDRQHGVWSGSLLLFVLMKRCTGCGQFARRTHLSLPTAAAAGYLLLPEGLSVCARGHVLGTQTTDIHVELADQVTLV